MNCYFAGRGIAKRCDSVLILAGHVLRFELGASLRHFISCTNFAGNKEVKNPWNSKTEMDLRTFPANCRHMLKHVETKYGARVFKGFPSGMRIRLAVWRARRLRRRPDDHVFISASGTPSSYYQGIMLLISCSTAAK